MVSNRFPWNAKYETVHRWLAYFIFIYTIMDLESRHPPGKKFWAKRKRNIYSWDYQRNVRFEEVHYGLLVMIVCDSNGIVYDIVGSSCQLS